MASTFSILEHAPTSFHLLLSLFLWAIDHNNNTAKEREKEREMLCIHICVESISHLYPI